MATSKLVIFCTILVLTVVKSSADSAPEGPDFSLKTELDQIKSRISFLESTIDERTHELRSKDESILQMEKNIKAKSDSIASLQFEIESLQGKGSLDVKYQAVKAHARAGELEMQVKTLRKEIEIQFKKKDALEVQAGVAEKKIRELNSNLENLRKINDEQKIRIRTTERALRLAEEEIMKAKLKATSLSKVLKEVHGAWLPPWLAAHFGDLQSYILAHWNSQGRPALDSALDKMAQAEKWVQPHFETVKTKGISTLKEWWLAFLTYVEPHVQTLTTRTIEVYDASKKTISLHVVKLRKMAYPYFLETKKFIEPYKPHFDKARASLKPYTKRFVRSYKKFIKSAAVYHRQVQRTVLELLKSYELTKPFATNELAWFAATSLFALPVIYLLKLPSAIFRKKPNRRGRHSHTHHTRRRVRRGHHEE